MAFYQFLIDQASLEDRPQEVVDYTKEIIKLAPGNLKARMTLGDYFYQKADYPQALKIFEEVKSRLPSLPKVNYYISKIHLATGDAKKALEAAEEEMLYNKNSEDGYVVAGEAHQALGDPIKAERTFEKAIAVNMKAAQPLAALAVLKFRQGHLEPARELLLRAIKEDGNDPMLHYPLGKVYKTIGQTPLAIEEFQVYLKLNPDGKEKGEVEQLINSMK